MYLSLIALLFAIAGFLILWFSSALKVQLLGAAILAAAFTILLAGMSGGKASVIHFGQMQPGPLPSHSLRSSSGPAASPIFEVSNA